jgi:cell division protein FtsW (lipid II flippase)
MPYKDLERKKEWERLHRPERLARRRELRRIEAEQRVARPEAPSAQPGGLGFLIPIVAGGGLAAYDPKLGMAAGGATLAIAAVFKKGWRWWVVGIVVLAVALFFYWNDKNVAETRSGETN